MPLYESKLAELEALAQKFPDRPRAMLKAAHAARKLGLHERALHWWRAAGEQLPERPQLAIECIRELMHLEHYDEAERQLQALPASLVDDVRTEILRIRLLARRDYAAAKRAFGEALRSTARADLPDLVRAGNVLGFHRESIQHLDAPAEPAGPNVAALAIALGRAWALSGEFPRARETVEELGATLLDPDQLLAAAALRLDADDAVGAAGALREIAARHRAAPDSLSAAQRRRACELCERADFDDAHAASLADLRAADEARPVPDLSGRDIVSLEDSRLWIESLIEAEEVDRAWLALREAQRRFSRRDLALENAALLGMDMRFDEQVDCLADATRSDPFHERFAAELVRCLTDHGRVAEAERILQLWIERRPGSSLWRHRQMHWAAGAYRDWAALIALHDEAERRVSLRARFDLRVHRAQTLMRMGKLDHADRLVDALRSDAWLVPMSADRRQRFELTTAEMLTRLGRQREGRRILDRLLATDPPRRLRDEIHRVSCNNEAFGGRDPERFQRHRNSISNERHHLRITPFERMAVQPPPLRTLVLVHLFYPELWPEIRDYLRSLQGTRFELCVAVGDRSDSSDVERAVREFEPKARVRRVENRGFDIGAHWQNLADIDLKGFDVVLLLQSKKSSHTRIGDVWRNNLTRSLIGTPERWHANLHAFAQQPRLGMIASALHQSSFHSWQYIEMKQVLQTLGLPTRFDALKDYQEFVTGTQFAIRADLLAEMHSKTRDRIAFEPYESLSLRQLREHTLAHAMERAFGLYVRWRDYEILWRP